MSIYLGLDCGGSSCRALAADEHGNILHQGHGGPANIATTPPGRIRKNLERACQDLESVDVAVGCFAGLLTESDRERAADLLLQKFPRATVRVFPDYVAAYMAAPKDTDLCVIAGTGSVICSRQGSGFVKSGGGGYLLGDWGSGFQYGKAAYQHFLRSPENASPALRDAILQRVGSTEPNELYAHLYRSGTPAPTLGKFLPSFIKDLKLGETYAVETVKDQTSRLVANVIDHIHTHFTNRKELQICLAGGLWEASSLFKQEFDLQLGEALPRIILTTEKIAQPPVRGALTLALEKLR